MVSAISTGVCAIAGSANRTAITAAKKFLVIFFIFQFKYFFFNQSESYPNRSNPHADQNPPDYCRVENQSHTTIQVVNVKSGISAISRVHGVLQSWQDEYQ